MRQMHFKQLLIDSTDEITENMRKRGGGIKDIVLKDLSDKEENVISCSHGGRCIYKTN